MVQTCSLPIAVLSFILTCLPLLIWYGVMASKDSGIGGNEDAVSFFQRASLVLGPSSRFVYSNEGRFRNVCWGRRVAADGIEGLDEGLQIRGEHFGPGRRRRHWSTL